MTPTTFGVKPLSTRSRTCTKVADSTIDTAMQRCSVGAGLIPWRVNRPKPTNWRMNDWR